MANTDRIAEIFKNRVVFITGGTGFLGKLLVEKLLRRCDVKCIYLLVRTKKGKSPEERLDDLFNNMLFDVIKREKPNFKTKCRIIPGDVAVPNLNISKEDRRTLTSQVDFIFHSAASTRFDDSVKTAVILNTRATKYVLDLAEECPNLRVLVHVSTAYAFPKEKVLYERDYKPPANPHELIKLIDEGKDVEEFLGDSPNTYTFSKALAEALVTEKMNKIPAIVLRPSVVCPTWKEPIAGWVHNLQGPMGLFVGAGKGIIRSMYMKGENYADFIPADITTNAMLICAWNYVTTKKDRIVNVTSSAQYNIYWEELIELGKDVVMKDIPFNGVVWYPGGSIKKSKLFHNVCFIFFQLLPAVFIDALLIVLGYKPILYQIQRRIQKGGEVFEYYTTRAWNFSNAKVDEIRERMNAIELERYKFDGEGLDVRKYLIDCILCVRRNNLKEADDTIPAAKRHMTVMWIVDLILKLVMVWGLVYYVIKLINTQRRLVQ